MRYRLEYLYLSAFLPVPSSAEWVGPKTIRSHSAHLAMNDKVRLGVDKGLIGELFLQICADNRNSCTNLQNCNKRTINAHLHVYIFIDSVVLCVKCVTIFLRC